MSVSSSPSSAIHDVFVYGTLLADEVVQERSETLQACAYVWVKKSDPDLYGDWDYKEWREKKLNDYLDMVREFVAEIEEPESELSAYEPSSSELQNCKSISS